MTKVVQDAINDQINQELSASYSYLAMASYCERQNFLGSSQWLRRQSTEEYMHAIKLFNFLLARNGHVRLKGIPEPPVEYRSVVEVFETAFEQEQEVSKRIDALYELALNEKAFAAMVELEWFLTEQVEEERTAREICAKFNMVKNDPAALLDLDRELGSRTTAPTQPPAP